MTYEQALINYKLYADEQGIPFRFVLKLWEFSAVWFLSGTKEKKKFLRFETVWHLTNITRCWTHQNSTVVHRAHAHKFEF